MGTHIITDASTRDVAAGRAPFPYILENVWEQKITVRLFYTQASGLVFLPYFLNAAARQGGRFV